MNTIFTKCMARSFKGCNEATKRAVSRSFPYLSYLHNLLLQYHMLECPVLILFMQVSSRNSPLCILSLPLPSMATTTETETPIPPASAPQLTVLTRVASIPLISDSLAAVHSTLATNAYTKTPYEAAQALGSRAYKVSEPIQARLAPVIVRADGYANKAVDVVESKYPYPFHAPTEEIYGTLRQHSEHAYGAANKTIDDRVKAPAFGIAQGIDQVSINCCLRESILTHARFYELVRVSLQSWIALRLF